MTTDFRAVVSTPPSGRSKALVLDHHEYAQKVLLHGRPIPWGNVSQYTSFLVQAQALLKPDTTLVDVGALYTNLLLGMPGLVAAMSARARLGYALETLLSDETAGARAVELTGAIAQVSKEPLVLQVPSPLRWLTRTHELAGAGSRADIEPHHGEMASAYVAEWLRGLSTLPVSLLLLDGRRADLPVLRLDVRRDDAPITCAARQLGWSVGQRTDEGVEVMGAKLWGATLPRRFWLSDDVSLPDGDFLVADLPGDAKPPTVLARLTALG